MRAEPFDRLRTALVEAPFDKLRAPAATGIGGHHTGVAERVSSLCLVVEDDGRGFEPNGTRSGGLANIRDRVEALHGQLAIESRLGSGTTVRAELPLSARATGQDV
jgi:signal transduction histidine kinase